MEELLREGPYGGGVGQVQLADLHLGPGDRRLYAGQRLGAFRHVPTRDDHPRTWTEDRVALVTSLVSIENYREETGVAMHLFWIS